jgi:tryptophan synthase alpha chain
LSNIGERFRTLGKDGALITYVMGGDPDVATTERIVESLIEGGADIVELGIPFSDPIADGRSIQEAGVRSLSSGTTPEDVLGVVRKVKQKHPDFPIAIMTYYNILYSPGLDRFLTGAEDAGVDGLIVPDLPLDETADYSRLAKRHGLDTILLAAPTTTADRLPSLIKNSSGFLYLVSLLGVTGARSELGEETLKLVRSAKRATRGKIPLAVGFGISKPEHVRAILGAGADGVIVGSSIVNIVASGKPEPEMLEELEDYVSTLKSATRMDHRGRSES